MRFFCLLLCAALLAACDDDSSVTADSKPPGDTQTDSPAADTIATDTVVSDTVTTDSVGDAPTGTQKLGQGCCAAGASGCTLGSCESGLSCFVISNGPYTDRGICSKPCTNALTDCACPSTTPGNLCPGGTPSCQQGQCMWLCLPDPQGCDSSQPCKCAANLLCLGVQGTNMCLPPGS
jgi:hypothetical protein